MNLEYIERMAFIAGWNRGMYTLQTSPMDRYAIDKAYEAYRSTPVQLELDLEDSPSEHDAKL